MGNKESAPKTDLNDISDTSTSECQLLPDKGIPICNDRTSETSVSDKTQVERRAVDVTNICADIKQTCQSFSENQDNFNIPNSSDSLHGMYSQEIFDKLSSEGQLLCNEGILVCTDMAPERETGVNDALECDGKTMSAVLLLPSNETELKQTAMQENSDFLKFCDITQLNCSPILPSHISANLHGLACDENTLDNIPDVIVKKTLFPAALNAAVQLTAEEKDRQCEINALFVGSTLNFAEDSIIKDSSMQLPIVISTKSHFEDGLSHDGNITTKKDSDLSCDIGPNAYSVENIGAHFPDGNDCFLKTSKNSSDENNITTKKDSELSCDIGPHTYSVENIGAHFPDGNDCFLKTSKNSSDENNITTKKDSDLSCDIGPHTYSVENIGAHFPDGNDCFLKTSKNSSDENNITTKKDSDLSCDIGPHTYSVENIGAHFPDGNDCFLKTSKNSSDENNITTKKDSDLSCDIGPHTYSVENIGAHFPDGNDCFLKTSKNSSDENNITTKKDSDLSCDIGPHTYSVENIGAHFPDGNDCFLKTSKNSSDENNITTKKDSDLSCDIGPHTYSVENIGAHFPDGNDCFLKTSKNSSDENNITTKKDSDLSCDIGPHTYSVENIGAHFPDGNDCFLKTSKNSSDENNITTKKDSDLSCDIGPHTYSVENIGAHFPDGNDCFLKTSKNSSDENNITTKKDSDLSCDIGPHTYSVENIGAHFPDGNDCFLKTSKNSSDENNITTKKDSDLSCDIGPHTYSVENIGAHFPDGNDCFLKTSKNSSDENNITTKKDSDLSCDIGPHTYSVENIGANFPDGNHCLLKTSKDSSDENNIRTKKGSDLSGDIDPPSYLLESTGENFPAGYGCSLEIFKDSSAFDFLMKRDENASICPSQGRLSVISRFDPLVSGISSAQNDIVKSPFQPLIELENSNNEASFHYVDSTKTCQINKNVNEEEFKNALKCHEMKLEESLITFEKDKVNHINVVNHDIDCMLLQKASLTDACDIMRNSIDKGVNFVHVESVNEKFALLDSTIGRKSSIIERDQALEDLRNVEKAFSNLMLRYNNAKVALEQMKENELSLKQEVEQCMKESCEEQEKYNALHVHADEQLNIVNEELIKFQKDHESEKAALTAMLRKSELRVRSLTTTLNQIVNDNHELLRMCEEFGYKKTM